MAWGDGSRDLGIVSGHGFRFHGSCEAVHGWPGKNILWNHLAGLSIVLLPDGNSFLIERSYSYLVPGMSFEIPVLTRMA